MRWKTTHFSVNREMQIKTRNQIISCARDDVGKVVPQAHWACGLQHPLWSAIRLLMLTMRTLSTPGVLPLGVHPRETHTGVHACHAPEVHHSFAWRGGS